MDAKFHFDRSKSVSGSGRVDMTAREWGPLRAVRPGFDHYWWFEHPGGPHPEFLFDASMIRWRARKGLEIVCPICKKTPKAG
jgi:hypothetical protein